MAFSVAIQMDPLSALHPEKDTKDATLILAREAMARGRRVFCYTPDRLSLRGDAVTAAAFSLELDEAQRFREGAEVHLDLGSDVRVVLMRQNPPFDMAYITATHMLQHVQPRTLVVNDPAAVRENPEKLLPLQFPEFVPPTLISADTAAIRAFHREQGEIILKPLYSYGGRGVFHVGRDGANLEALLETGIQDRVPLVAQRFLPEVKTQMRRIAIIDGTAKEAIAYMPATGEVRSNINAGGHSDTAQYTRRQLEAIEAIGPVLREKGVLFAVLDMIGDWVIEINITSPGGLSSLHKRYGTKPEADFWDAVEKRL